VSRRDEVDLARVERNEESASSLDGNLCADWKTEGRERLAQATEHPVISGRHSPPAPIVHRSCCFSFPYVPRLARA
jgi:hypothetical protein